MVKKEALRRKIEQAFGCGNLETALGATQEFLARFPTQAFGWKALAAILIQNGRLEEARPSLLKAIAIDRLDPDNWVNLGNLERGQGNISAATECYRKAISLRPDFPTAQVNLATVLSETGNPRQAIELLTGLLKAKPRLAAAHLTLGNINKAAGKLPEAEHCYLAALAIQGDYFEALLNLSSVYREQGQYQRAHANCQAALAQRPHSAMAHSNLGNIFAAMRNTESAIEAYQRAIQLDPGFLDAYVNLSNILRQTGDIDEAIRLCERVIALANGHLKARLNLSFCLYEQRRFQAALAELEILLAAHPDNPPALILSGLIMSEDGAAAKALQLAELALGLAQGDPYVQLGAASIHAALGQTTKAEMHFKEAIRLEPNNPEAHLNLANLYLTLGQHTEALALVSKALGVFPRFGQAHSTKALILRELRLLNDARAAAEIALELRPDVAPIQSAIGLIKLDFGEVIEAGEHLALALRFDPGSAIAQINYANALREMGRHEESLALYRNAVKACSQVPAAEHFTQVDSDTVSGTQRVLPQACSNYLLALNYHSNAPDSAIHANAQAFAPHFGGRLESGGRKRSPAAQRPRTTAGAMRIGFVSGDLREHPVGYFTEGLIEQLAVAGHWLYGYPTTPVEDDLTERMRNRFQAWRPIYRHSDAHAAEMIATDGLDVLLDLSGHTAANRLGVFRHRPAPVQVSWLGYCGTTGLTEMDFLLADEVAIRPEEEIWYTERVIRIDGCYACLASLPDIRAGTSPPMIQRGYCTFGSFNNLAKIGEAVIRAWCEILVNVQESRLFLKSKQFADPRARKMLSDAMGAMGVDEYRLIFEAADARQNYLKSFEQVDFALDPFPYPGFTTSIEALWMGVPVLTMRGSRFIQRNGEIVMEQVGNRDWIASSIPDYVDRAVSFANSPTELQRLRSCLRSRLSGSPLMDICGFTRNFVSLLRKL